MNAFGSETSMVPAPSIEDPSELPEAASDPEVLDLSTARMRKAKHPRAAPRKTRAQKGTQRRARPSQGPDPRPTSRVRLIVAGASLVGVLLGNAVTLGYQRLLAEPRVDAADLAAELRSWPIARLGDGIYTDGHFWLKQCDAGSSDCTGYVAAIVEAYAGLGLDTRYYCLPSDWRVAEVEAAVIRELRYAEAADKRGGYGLLDTQMPAIVLVTLQRAAPCKAIG
jgi:hypothetical protein